MSRRPLAPFRLATAALVSSGVLACANDAVIAVDLGGDEPELAFPVILEQERPVAVGAPFGTAVADVGGARIAKIDLEPGQALMVISLSAGDLVAMHQGIKGARVGQSTLALEPPPPPPGRRAPERRIRLPVPSTAEVSVIDASAGAGAVALRAPTDAERALIGGFTVIAPEGPTYCRSGFELRPFGAEPQMLAPADTGGVELFRVRWLDADRIVALGDSEVYLLRRGDPKREAAAAERALLDGPGIGAVFVSGLFVSPAPGGGASDWIVHVAGKLQVFEPARESVGRLWEIELADGRFGAVRTATDAAGVVLRDVTVDPRGVTVVAGDLGFLAFQRPGGMFERGPMLERNADGGIPRSPLRRVLATRSLEAPHVIASDTRLYRGDVASGMMHADPYAGIETDLNVEDVELFDAASPDRLWIGGESRLLEGDAGAWREIRPTYPASFADCVRHGLDAPSQFYEITFAGDWALITSDCSALLAVRRSDPDCVEALIPPGEPVAPKRRVLRASAERDGRVIVVGQEGLVFELARP